MKTYNKILVFTLSCLTLGSCQDLDSLNKDPNKVTSAAPHLLLTPMAKKAFTMQGISKEYASRMLISTDGENTSQYYKWDRSDFGEYKDLVQVDKMMQEAQESQKTQYLAVGHFLKAYFFYQITLRFGDIPYSQALQGEQDIKFPSYDPQEQVLEGVLKQLDLAQSLIELDQTLQGDIIYGGDLDKWKRLINSYELKVLMSLSKKQKVGDIDVAARFNEIYQNQELMRNNADSGYLTYFDQAGSRYPQFNSSSYGSGMYMSDTFIDLLQDLKDPRLFCFAQPTAKALEEGLLIDDFNAYNGGDPVVAYAENEKLVSAKNISKVNSRYYQNPTNEPTGVLSYSELQFILAEAASRGWISGDPELFYNKGIQANFEFYNLYAKQYATYYTNQQFDKYISQDKVKFQPGDLQSELKQILTQKYITMFHQGNWSIYYDNLRTGYPEFKLQDGITPPKRWIYPLSEYNTNQANLEKAIERQFQSQDNIRSVTWWLK
ncbi:SusD/RagB family nutrient-binding outer membrane lipoprotein [Myroides sp. LJL110]